MIPELTDMTSRVELLESFQDILAVHEIPQDYCSEGITDESKDFYLVYRKQKKLIENAIRRELPASYPIAAGSLKAAVLNGFSVYTVYGADMYDTFLGVHPHFSGAYIAILQYLFALYPVTYAMFFPATKPNWMRNMLSYSAIITV